MQKNMRYSLTNLKRHSTKYGERIMVELDNLKKLFLPERYNSFSDQQLVEMGGGKYDLINRGPEGKTFKIELLPKIICKEKSGMLPKITSNEAQTTASSSFPEQKLLAIEAPPPSPLPELSKHLENNPSILSLPSILESSQNNTQMPEEDPDVVNDDHHDYGVIDSEDSEDEENYDPQDFVPQDFVQNFYSQKPYLGF
jgi:hypothetical protein